MAVLHFFDEPKTIYDCSAFLCRMQFMLCCNGLWKHRNSDGHFITNKWTRLYSMGMATAVVFGLVYTIYSKLADPEQSELIHQLDNLLLSITFLELFMSTCMYVITVVSLQWMAKRHMQIYDRINALDQRLIREFGVNLNYRKLLQKNVIVITAVTAIYFGAVCSALGQMTNGDHAVVLMGATCYTMITGAPHFSGYVHMNFTEILRIRFRLLQRLLSREYLCWKFPETRQRERRIQSVIAMVMELHCIVGDINAVYMLTLLSGMAHDFTLTTSELYMIFGRSIDGENGSNKLLWYVLICMLPPFYKMSTAPVYCEMTITEGQKCLRLIEQVDNWFPHNGNRVTRMVSSMMFWRLENKIEFTCGLNIIFNKTIMAIITAVILNYLLILIQFRMTQEMGDHIEQQRNTLQEWIGVNY